MKEMFEVLHRRFGKGPSSEAAQVALVFANAAWNKSAGFDYASEGHRNDEAR